MATDSNVTDDLDMARSTVQIVIVRRFDHEGLCQVHTKLVCTQLVKTFVVEMSYVYTDIIIHIRIHMYIHRAFGLHGHQRSHSQPVTKLGLSACKLALAIGQLVFKLEVGNSVSCTHKNILTHNKQYMLTLYIICTSFSNYTA